MNNTQTVNGIDHLLSQVGLPGSVPTPAPVRGQTVSEEGKARSQADFEAAQAMGFAPKQSIYERGTMVVQAGVNKARRERAKFDKLPLAEEAARDLHERVQSEERFDETVRAHILRMNKEGQIVLPTNEGGDRFLVEHQAIGGLASRAGIPQAGHLKVAWPELRALIWNRWQDRLSTQEKANNAELLRAGKNPTHDDVVLRTRKCGDERSIYGTVSPGYTAYDADQIAQAIEIATKGTGARAKVLYDGSRTKFEVLFHSDVKPTDYVAGEFFKGGVVISTSDIGESSIVGRTILWQNLCLNLAIVDKATAGLFRIRHMGNVQELAKKFREGFATGMQRLEHFRERWGFAVRENVVTQARAAHEETKLVDVEDIFPGLFRGILDAEILKVKGDRETVVDALMDCWRKDESSATATVRTSRAAVVNAITRYAHEVNQDPWAEEDIQLAAGQIAWSSKPLPFAAKE